MEFRHNTALLERAIEFIVQRASIPFKKAEAEAAERLAQATARRRLATGAAIALAAVGIGVGVFFGLREPRLEPERVAPLPVVLPNITEPPVNPPNGDDAGHSRTREQPAAIYHPPIFNYEKFASQEADFMGRRWDVVAGHHYNNDTDVDWTNAWCYTEQEVDGLTVKIPLVARKSPTAAPTAPIASAESLSKVGLSDSSALDLASYCHWLDRRQYLANEYAAVPGRTPTTSYLPPVVPPPVPLPSSPPTPIPEPTPAQIPASTPAPILAAPFYLARDGFDMPNNDLENMPINSDTQSECEVNCNSTNDCVAYVFNKQFKKCFLKSSVGTLFANNVAYTGYKSNSGGSPRISLLQTHDKTAQIGRLYKSIPNMRHMDCILECDKDLGCVAFNYDLNSRQCDMLQEVTKSQPMPTIFSGLKSSVD